MKYLVHWLENRLVGAPSPLIAHHESGLVIVPSRPNYAPPTGTPATHRGAEYPNPGADEWCWLDLTPNGRMYIAYPLAPEVIAVNSFLIEGVMITPPSPRDKVVTFYRGGKLFITVEFASEAT